jgi:hypothetical protein
MPLSPCLTHPASRRKSWLARPMRQYRKPPENPESLRLPCIEVCINSKRAVCRVHAHRDSADCGSHKPLPPDPRRVIMCAKGLQHICKSWILPALKKSTIRPGGFSGINSPETKTFVSRTNLTPDQPDSLRFLFRFPIHPMSASSTESSPPYQKIEPVGSISPSIPKSPA